MFRDNFEQFAEEAGDAVAPPARRSSRPPEARP